MTPSSKTISRLDADMAEKQNAEDVLDAAMGSQVHLAMIVMDAKAACEEAFENFQYDEGFPADVLAAYKVIAGASVDV